MADSEWYEIDPHGGQGPFRTFESADEAAQKAALHTPDGVAIVRYTSTTVRRYKRQVTVTVEDVTPPA